MHIRGQPIWPLINCCRKFSAAFKLRVDGQLAETLRRYTKQQTGAV